MKKSLLRAALLAFLPLCMVGSVVVTAPAVAADKEKPKISRSITKQIQAAQKASNDKDWATVIAKCKEAQAVEGISGYDKYIIDRFLGIAYLSMGDHASATVAVTEAVMNPEAPAEERAQLLRPALALQNEASNYNKVLELGKLAIQDNQADDTVYGEMAVAAFNLKDYPTTIDYANKSIDLATAAGKEPVYTVYQVLSVAQDQSKNRAGTIKTLEKMASIYGKPDDWRNLIDFSLAELPPGEKSVAALDIYRLRLTVGATSAAPDYMAMVDAAQFVRSPGDVIRALERAVDKGVITSAKAAASLNKARADAKRDEPILPQAEAAAAKHASAKEGANVAEAYFGYGRYADAQRVAEIAVKKKGTASVAEAQIILGMSLVMQGNDTAGAQALDAVRGDAALQRAAQLWKVYATRTYGRTPPAAAPAAQ